MRSLFGFVLFALLALSACGQEPPQTCDADHPCPDGQACVLLSSGESSQQVSYCQDELQVGDGGASSGDADTVIDAVPPPPPTPDTGVGPVVDAALPDASPPSMEPCPAGTKVVSVTPSPGFPAQLTLTLNYGTMAGQLCIGEECEAGTLATVGLSGYELSTPSYYFRTQYQMGTNLPTSFSLVTAGGGSILDMTGLGVSTIGGSGVGSYIDALNSLNNDSTTVMRQSRDLLVVRRDGDQSTLTVGTICR